MKALLFSVTAGEGHNTTAKAIATMLEAQGMQTKVLDAYRISGKLMYHIIAKGYLLVTSLFGRPYGWVYRLCEKRRGNSYKKSLNRLGGRRVAKKFKKQIDAFDPDVIICTHSFAARIVDIVKERYGLRAKTLGIVTDFTIHPYWEEALRFDRLVLPNELLRDAAKKKGFTDAQLLPTGIPIHPKFAQSVPKEDARRALGLEPDLPTLLIMSGSMGHGNMKKELRVLDRSEASFQIIVVCGRNKRAYKKISRAAFRKKVLTLGFVDHVPLLMDAADCIVSKPGGLTTSEALAKSLPMIISNPIAGHEERNVAFLTGCSASVAVCRRLSLSAAAEQLLSSPARVLAMQESIARIRKPNALPDLCTEAFRLAKEAASDTRS